MTATPNHALQRTAPAVTLAASAAAFPPTMQPARQPPPSLSLGSLGVATRSMSIRYIVFALTLALAVIARAVDKPFVVMRELPWPDHLMPVDPYPGESHIRYTDQLRSRFKLDFYFFAQMVVRPSFSSEYVVRLHGTENDSYFDTTNKFFLTYSVSDQSIYHSMPENNSNKKQREVSITVTTVELSKPLATRIKQLWERMLLRTGYPQAGEGDGRGLDGVTFEFATRNVYGTTWSPHERKSPLLFIELGDSLIAYCKAAPAERPAATKEIENKAEQLEKYLNKHPSK